jgi:hypothetical protein
MEAAAVGATVLSRGLLLTWPSAFVLDVRRDAQSRCLDWTLFNPVSVTLQVPNIHAVVQAFPGCCQLDHVPVVAVCYVHRVLPHYSTSL